MKRQNYRKRLLDARITDCLSVAAAVCLEGPKWCGKTWTSEYHSKSAVYIGDPAGNYQNRTLALLSPLSVLAGETPRLIDEWQEVPSLWDAVRSEADRRSEKGVFILTGSATPNHHGKMHSGAGRIVKLRMRPMSLFESGDSAGQISLEALCHGNFQPALTDDIQLSDLIHFVIRGGWPGNLHTSAGKAHILPEAYIRAVLDEDLKRLDGIKHDRKKMERLLRSLARNESTTASNNTLKKDMADTEGSTIDVETVASYLETLGRLFITDNQPPFSTNLRSSVRIKQQEKRHLADPSLAAALLNATPEKLQNDLETFGFLFESLCERDLRIYAESFGGKLYHYQDYQGNEADAVIELPDGTWAAVEIKLGAHQIDAAAAQLVRLDRLIGSERPEKRPSALIVLCGMTSAAYQREDGVYVVPLTALKN